MMSLLNCTQSQPLTGRFSEVLEDIVHNIEIRSDFSIRHPDYKPLELPSEAISRFQKIPKQMQQKYLTLQLRSFLYGIYYNGSMRSALALDGEENSLPLDLENNTVLGVDVGFYERLHESNYGEGYFDPNWSVVRKEPDDTLVVTKSGLRLYVQPDKHLQTIDKTTVVGDRISIKMPKNRVQNGFYMAVSNVGLNHIDDTNNHLETVRIYFNITPEGAVAVMGHLTQNLNKLAIPFSFKVLYNPKEYQRYDSGVLYFHKRDYELVKQVSKTLYQEYQSYFKAEIPLFTKHLAPGLGLAEEPDQKYGNQESFGMNRCQIVANGLLTAWNQSDDSPQERKRAILDKFSLLDISLDRIYLNSKSKDIYELFDI